MAKRLTGKVALITGASSGIGAAMAREFARRGADLVLTARRWERLEALALELRATGRRAVVVQCDVTVDGDLERAVATGLEELGRLDFVVANAGFGVAGWFHRRELGDYRRQRETNVFGVLRTAFATREALESSRGCFAVMGSVMSFVATPGTSPYAMS
ncbi:MAG TPA: SDR family NAD(P)-dependent oxidoreductase, partial [Candidatus Sulfomarinibacteraceae bacterium]|nr:SDR family NAD(P)-dependent oxidoreductase [Candidatus Sulfomarinibacteraceae bacterium]